MFLKRLNIGFKAERSDGALTYRKILAAVLFDVVGDPVRHMDTAGSGALFTAVRRRGAARR
jgi:hypothetical protein